MPAVLRNPYPKRTLVFLLCAALSTGVASCTSTPDDGLLLEEGSSNRGKGSGDAENGGAGDTNAGPKKSGDTSQAAAAGGGAGASGASGASGSSAKGIVGTELGPNKRPVLPLPNRTAYYTVKSFLEEFRDAYVAHLPLSREYQVYFQHLNGGVALADEERDALKLRIVENFERTHWAFVGGALELLEYLQNPRVLQIDKEENYVARMRVLAFLARELAEVSGEAKYTAFARKLYITTSEVHFGRVIRPLPEPANP